VWGIGVDTDQSFLGPHVLTSVVKRFDQAFRIMLRQLKRGSPQAPPRDLVLTLADRGVGLGKISGKVPAAIRAELDDLRHRIVAGEIRVTGVIPNPR
jgi:basic membrane lipoprotein Med (substrate-binding protein (PBP1-ABC) superfamily)